MRWGLAGALIAIAVVAIAGYAIGAGKASKDLVLCATKKGGDLSLANAKGKCAKGEKKLTVAKEGPVGPAGPTGPAGAPGADANATLEAVHYVTSPPSKDCATQPSVFCYGSSLDTGWANFADSGHPGYEKVGYYKEPNGTVHLVGTAAYENSGGEGSGFTPPGIFTLPPGYRPGQTRVFKVPGGSGSTFAQSITVEVKANGLVAPPLGQQTLALDGISFRTP